MHTHNKNLTHSLLSQSSLPVFDTAQSIPHID